MNQLWGRGLMDSVCLMCCLCAISVAGSRAFAAEPEWRVGLARVKITPEQPIFLAGYASRNKPFERVETDLFVKALALEDRDGKRAVLVTSDLIGLPADRIAQTLLVVHLRHRERLERSLHPVADPGPAEGGRRPRDPAVHVR